MKKFAGVLVAAAVVAMSSVAAFAAESPKAADVVNNIQDNAITSATVTVDSSVEAPEDGLHLVTVIGECADEDKTVLDAAKPSDYAVVAYVDVDMYWANDANEKGADYEGAATITFNYDAKEGDLILHKPEGAAVETLTPVSITAGTSATVNVDSRSPFAVIRKTSTSADTETTAAAGSSQSQVLGASVNMTSYVIIIAGLVACAAVLGSVLVLRKKH